MFLDIIFLIAGLVLILAGANYMTDGRSEEHTSELQSPR